MAEIKPTLLLIPGAWHIPAHFKSLREHLHNAGYPTTCEKLPSVDCLDPSGHTLQTDAEFIRSRLLMPLLDEGKRVVLVMHSYGGNPGSAAAYGLSEEERRKEGLQGGVVGLIYITAFIVPSGASNADQKPPPLRGFTVAENGVCTIPAKDVPHNFYNALSPPELADHYAFQTRPMAFNVFLTSASATAHESPAFKNRMGYIHCTEDRAVPMDLQRVFTKRAGIEKTVVLETDHCPFLTMPARTAEVVEEMVKGFEGVGV